MPGFNPEKLNIHDLTVEEPEKEAELPFDPEKEITDEMWRGMVSWQKLMVLKAESSEKNRTRLLNSAAAVIDLAHLKILSDASNKHMPEIDANKLNTFLDKLCEDSKHFSGGNYHPETNVLKIGYSLASSAAILGLKELPKSVQDDLGAQSEMIRSIQYPELSNPEHASQIFAMGKMGGLDLRIDLTDPEKKILIDHLEKLKGNSYSSENSRKLLSYCAFLKIIGIDVSLSAENWKNFLEDLESVSKKTEDRDSAYSDMTDRLFFLTILSADEVKIPEGGGLKLIRHKKDLKQEIPQVPEQRQF